jgi:hypothetical protein
MARKDILKPDGHGYLHPDRHNTVRLEYFADTDKPTVNLTNHATSIRRRGRCVGTSAWLAASEYTPASEQLIPTGQIATAGNALTSHKHLVGARIEQLYRAQRYDHNVLAQARLAFPDRPSRTPPAGG